MLVLIQLCIMSYEIFILFHFAHDKTGISHADVK